MYVYVVPLAHHFCNAFWWRHIVVVPSSGWLWLMVVHGERAVKCFVV